MREAVLVVLSSMAQKTLDPEKSSEKKFAKSHKKIKMPFPVVYIFSTQTIRQKKFLFPAYLENERED